MCEESGVAAQVRLVGHDSAEPAGKQGYVVWWRVRLIPGDRALGPWNIGGLSRWVPRYFRGDLSERVTGIEPALSAWEADVLPLNYTRVEPSGS